MPASSQLKYDALLGLCYMPAIVVICLPGFMFDRVPAASIIASGALTRTFGTNKTWGDSTCRCCWQPPQGWHSPHGQAGWQYVAVLYRWHHALCRAIHDDG
ncbi:hypothetical protein AV903_18020 [Erwinia tracheiphila]|uniref:Uncharacterized protein n=1 Tax=Erwinia tracheiphila TaxID=65700 RepID=A0A345CVP2_9GAMM|nr:hypothetical protein AV903_18020 [Erwinia tracheiphila]